MTQPPYSPALVYWTKRWAPDQEKLTSQLAAFYLCPGAKKLHQEDFSRDIWEWEVVLSHLASVWSCE